MRNNDQERQLRARGYLGDEIVTGEAVVLQMPSATAASRIGSGAIDWILYMLCFALSAWTLSKLSGSLSSAVTRSILISLMAFWMWLVPALISALSHGSSLGKLITGTRVVRSDGARISIRQAFIRATIGVFEITFSSGAIAILAIVFSARSRRFGDMAADTYVVRWPKSKKYAPPAQVPPSLQSWAAGVWLRPLPGGLTLNLVNHLRSRGALTPEARSAQAQILAGAAEPFVSPPPPWGTPAEEFIEAVVALQFRDQAQRGEKTLARQQMALGRAASIPFAS